MNLPGLEAFEAEMKLLSREGTWGKKIFFGLDIPKTMCNKAFP